mmetsp:Transcript_120/g.412  ORF Transcript_120/g.412 Transcript_120/m.412 type:complete len:100 (+) Transcript_120:2406-2705(+)
MHVAFFLHAAACIGSPTLTDTRAAEMAGHVLDGPATRLAAQCTLCYTTWQPDCGHPPLMRDVCCMMCVCVLSCSPCVVRVCIRASLLHERMSIYEYDII